MEFASKVILVSCEQIFWFNLWLDTWWFWNFDDFDIETFLLDKGLQVFFQFFVVDYQQHIYFKNLDCKQKRVCFSFVEWREPIDNCAWTKHLRTRRSNELFRSIVAVQKIAQIVLQLAPYSIAEFSHLSSQKLLRHDFVRSVEKRDCLGYLIARQGLSHDRSRNTAWWRNFIWIQIKVDVNRLPRHFDCIVS